MRKALIVWGGWPGHTPEACAHTVVAMLQADGFEVQISDTVRSFGTVDLTALSLIVPIITQSTIEKDEVAKLCAAVEGGVGLAGFHGGMCDAFRDSVPYQFMTGAR